MLERSGGRWWCYSCSLMLEPYLLSWKTIAGVVGGEVLVLLSCGEVEVVVEVPPHTGSSNVLKDPSKLSGIGTCYFRRRLPVGRGPL